MTTIYSEFDTSLDISQAATDQEEQNNGTSNTNTDNGANKMVTLEDLLSNLHLDNEEVTSTKELVEKLHASLNKVKTEPNPETFGSIPGATSDQVLLELLKPNSSLNKELRNLYQKRILYCEPHLPKEKPNGTLSVSQIKLACWNAGDKKLLTAAVLPILMNIMKMDVILVQEVKKLDFDDLPGKSNYSIMWLPADPRTGTLKRGLFIMHRRESGHSNFFNLFNPIGIVGGDCAHTANAVKILSGNVEVASVDVPMENQMQRLINIYHASQTTAKCPGSLENVLQPFIENVQGVLMGDANLKYHEKMDKNGPFDRILEKYRWKRILPKEWKTFKPGNRSKPKTEGKSKLKTGDKPQPKTGVKSQPKTRGKSQESQVKTDDNSQSKTGENPHSKTGDTSQPQIEDNIKTENNSQPDIIHSSIAKKNIIVHKPVDPTELVEKCTKMGTIKDAATKALCEDYCKLDMDKKAFKYHFVMFVELGNNINNGTEYECCPPKEEDSTVNTNTDQAGTSAQETAGNKSPDQVETSPQPTSESASTSSAKSDDSPSYHCSNVDNDCKFIDNILSQL